MSTKRKETTSDESNHDPVVVELLRIGAVDSDAVESCARFSGGPAATWRDLAAHPGVDRQRVYAEAARLSGIELQTIDAWSPPDDLLRSMLGLFDEDIALEALKAGLLPVEILTDPNMADFTIAFATHDPLRQSLHSIFDNRGVNVVMRYAPESVIRERILATGIVGEHDLIRWGDHEDPPVEYAVPQNAGNDVEGFTLDMTAVPVNGAHTETTSGAIPSLADDIAKNIAANMAKEVDMTEEDVQMEADVVSDSMEVVVDFDVESEDVFAEGPEVDFATDIPNETEKPASMPPRSQSEKYDLDMLREALRDRVVGMLVRKEFVTQQQVLEALKAQKASPREALWRLLATTTDVDRNVVYREAASVYAFRSAELIDRDPKFAKLVMDAFPEEKRNELLSMRVFPIEYQADSATGGAKLGFATHDPARPEVHRILQKLKVGRFQLYYAPESYVTDLIQAAFPRRNEFLDRMSDDPMATDLGTSFEEEGGLIDESALEAEISRSTLINLFEATLLEATRRGASDIHVFPNPHRKVEIHMRIDGRLFLWHTEEHVHPEAFLAVIKDNSKNVDRFERDAAQDGYIQRRIDDALIRYRVSVLPIATASQEIRAESIVIRVLDDRKVVTDLRKLGMLQVALDRFNQAIRQPHGMVILTGPTGSGKSTTLVAALHQVVSPEINVLTVEDPVEYIIAGVRQIKLNAKLDLDQALRAILRHDPDVVMVGEMRDKATADLAIKLANTGHLAFSTLHTNDAPSAISRLYKMGVEPFLIAYAINLVVAQRLIRSLCPTCKTVDEETDPLLAKLVGFSDAEIKGTIFYKAGTNKKCKTCGGSAYKGRRALCETLYFSPAIRHIILESAEAIDEDQIRSQGQKEGMLTLQDSAREIVKLGDTSIAELIRVTAVE
jgi:type IV pilus assembly protein PilB